MTLTFDIIGNDKATYIVGGDNKQLLISIPDIPTGVELAEAWMTAKANEDDSDPGLFQKIITATDQPGMGQIVDTGLVSHIGSVRIDLSREETAALVVPDPFYKVLTNFYDVQLLTVGGQLETSIEGKICAFKGITQAS